MKHSKLSAPLTAVNLVHHQKDALGELTLTVVIEFPSSSPARLRAQMQIAITASLGSLAQFVSHYGSAEV